MLYLNVMNRKGFAMLEVIIVLVIIALLAIAVFRMNFGGTNTPREQEQGENAVQRSKDLQQKLNTQNQEQQKTIDTLAQ
ncbi:MAG: hypothetical protein UY96_C0020G0022 [Parcubacteria group bacterium GW2011_GWB1_56_8]|nr:MAG: hypothetical protein UY96_C0020G0022 [Parcubacteria group bacterium GW2011_GWB1_56_8]